jgi:hypothetical protein
MHTILFVACGEDGEEEAEVRRTSARRENGRDCDTKKCGVEQWDVDIQRTGSWTGIHLVVEESVNLPSMKFLTLGCVGGVENAG